MIRIIFHLLKIFNIQNCNKINKNYKKSKLNKNCIISKKYKVLISNKYQKLYKQKILNQDKKIKK